jgi:hypothetical protein
MTGNEAAKLRHIFKISVGGIPAAPYLCTPSIVELTP